MGNVTSIALGIIVAIVAVVLIANERRTAIQAKRRPRVWLIAIASICGVLSLVAAVLTGLHG